MVERIDVEVERSGLSSSGIFAMIALVADNAACEVRSAARYFTPHPREAPLGNLGPMLKIGKSKSALPLRVVGGAQ